MLDSLYASWGDFLGPWIVPLLLVGVVFTPAAIWLLMWTGRRRFSRRNIAGIEEFESYGKAVGSRFLEGLIDTAAALLLIIGLFAAFAGAYGIWMQTY